MPRSNRPRRRERSGSPQRDLEASLAGLQRTESHPDGDWVVRRVTGAAATRAYVCPGCAQQVAPGTAHVVAWPAEGLTGDQAALDQRRHWHTPCWQHRARRRPR